MWVVNANRKRQTTKRAFPRKKQCYFFLGVCASFSRDSNFNLQLPLHSILFVALGFHLILDWSIYLAATTHTVGGCGELKHDVFDRVGSLSMQRCHHMSWASETK